MLKLKIKEDKKIENHNVIISFDHPTHIYISLKRGNQTYLPYVRKGDYVYQEEKIAIRKKDHFPLFSSISGIVEYIDQKEIIIKNDYKNRIRDYQNRNHEISQYTKQEIENTLFQLGIMNIGVKEIEPYQKLNSNHTYKYFIINALRQEPYISLETFQLKLEKKAIFELMEAFLDIYNFEQIIIVVPKNHSLFLNDWKQNNIEHKIKLVELEEYYGLASAKELIWKLKKITYEKDPIEKGILMFNVSTILAVYKALKTKHPQTRMLVQFTGDMWKNNCYMEVRLGTYMKEVLKKLEYKRAKEVLFLEGGLMQGKAEIPDNVIIDVETPFYSAWRTVEKVDSKSCVRCGKCVEVCPMHLNPVLVMEAVSKKQAVKRFKVEKCNDCGLCSYVCPSNISVHQFLKKAKEDLE